MAKSMNLFRISKNCEPSIKNSVGQYKKYSLIVGISVLMISTIFLAIIYNGMETTLYFHVNSFDDNGNPLGQIITTRPDDDINFDYYYNHYLGYVDHVPLSPSLIQSIYTSLVGFVIIEESLAEKLVQDPHMYHLFFLYAQYLFGINFISDDITPILEIINPEYMNFLGNEKILTMTGNMFMSANNDLYARFKSGSYCIPIISTKIIFTDPRNTDNILTIGTYGVWNTPLLEQDVNEMKMQKGIWEIRASSITFNTTLINAYTKVSTGNSTHVAEAISYFQTQMDSGITFSDNWVSRGWFLDDKSIFTPITQF